MVLGKTCCFNSLFRVLGFGCNVGLLLVTCFCLRCEMYVFCFYITFIDLCWVLIPQHSHYFYNEKRKLSLSAIAWKNLVLISNFQWILFWFPRTFILVMCWKKLVFRRKLILQQRRRKEEKKELDEYDQYKALKKLLEKYETKKKSFISEKSNSVRSRGVYSWGKVGMNNKCIPTAWITFWATWRKCLWYFESCIALLILSKLVADTSSIITLAINVSIQYCKVSRGDYVWKNK